MQNKTQNAKVKAQNNNSKRKTNIIERILQRTRESVDERKKRHPGKPRSGGTHPGSDSGVALLPRMTRNSFKDAITKREVAIIAEVKFASPTEPHLGSPDELLSRVREYEAAEADAISIVTERHFFQGDPLHVGKIKQAVSLPVLQKDFIIDEYQIYEAALGGADAILLIAKLVSKKELVAFVTLAKKLELEPVVEINDEEDLKKALATITDIIAVNARDLDSFVVDIDRACNLLNQVCDDYIRLAFSGVFSRKEVEKYQDAGAQGVLVGTSLMKAKNVKDFMLSLRGRTTKQSAKKKIATGSLSPRNERGIKVKICGIRTLEAAQAAMDAGADFLGFIFVPGTKRYIEPKMAKKIIEILRLSARRRIAQDDRENGKVKIVGVFKDENIDTVNKITHDLGLDFVQLHGNENNDYMKQIKTPIIKSITVDDNPRNLQANYFILDRKTRGEGQMVNLKKAEGLALGYPLFFAGGLTSENVSEVVRKVRPFAVDVAGGVETNGLQDIDKIRLFIRAVRHSGELCDSRIDYGQARMTMEDKV